MHRLAIAAALVILLALGALGASGCARTGGRIPEPSSIPRETTEVSVYFATGRSLVEEVYVVDAEDPMRASIEKWLAAQPIENTGIAIVQPEAEVLSVKLDDKGLATIDWNEEVLAFEATDSEKLIALGGILRTMGEYPEVKKVSFSVEGKTSGSLDGKDIEAFWGAVSLKGQPWDVLRRPAKSTSSTETTPGK